jgi:hypothetical protein
MATRISRFGHLSRLLCGLGVPKKMVEKFTLHGAKQSLLGRSKARLSSRTLMLAYPIEGEKLLKVHAGKFWASIDRNRCW